MATKLVTERRAICPHCDATDSTVDHLQPGASAGPWYCKTCGRSYALRVEADGEVVVAKRAGRTVRTYDVLVLKPQDKPVYFIVESMRFEGEGWQHEDYNAVEHKRFYYEEHSCPTNWLKPEMVYFEGDADPHGLIEFVATRDEDAFPPDEVWGPNDRDRAFVEFIERSQQHEPAAR